MGNPTNEILNPLSLVLPSVIGCANPQTGLIGLSGANLLVWDGTSWIECSGVNTGDV